MEKQVVTHPEMPAPYGAYSTAVRAGGFLFLSGQAGVVPETGAKAGDDFASQARQALENVRRCLACAGASLDDVVKVIVWLTDEDHRAALNALFAEYFPNDPPTRSTPIVKLPMGFLLSVEATAVAPD